MTDGPVFEDDLRAAREARGMTLDEIQQKTRIPVDVLSRFEAGYLVGDATYNEVYLRAFLQSYARAIGLPGADVAAAYERQKAGAYRGELGPGYDAPADTAAQRSDAETSAEPPAAGPAVVEPIRAPGSPQPRVVPTPPVSTSVRPTAPIPSSRASRRGVPGSNRAFDKNWGAILGLAALTAAVLGAALWWLVFRDPAREQRGQAPPAAEAVGVGAGATAGPRLQLPLRVTVTAAGDGLQSFRVSRDGTRAPYWIDQGASQTFEADSSVVLWGEDGDAARFEDAIVEVQGLRWTPPSGRPVTLSAQTGQRLLDSLSAAR